MLKIAVLYHSGFGHTKVIAEEITKGADNVDGVNVDLLNVDDLADKLDTLKQYNTMVFGAPTYMGSLSATFKAFMDKSSKNWFTQDWKNKLAAGFTNSHSMSGDKQNSLIQLVTFAAQHGMTWLPLGLENQSGNGDVPGGAHDAVNRIGSSLGLMAQSENSDPSVTPGSGDKKTAFLFGERIADATLRWK